MEEIEVTLVEPTTVLVKEYKAGKNIKIEDFTIHNTYEYQLPSNVVRDSSYVHTDNNFTDNEKAKLANLENADLSGYYTKDETDEKITSDLGNYYTKNETRTMILQDLESYYTKDEIDGQKTDTDTKITNTNNKFADYYTKTETDNKINDAKTTVKSDISNDYYTKSEVNSMISGSTGGASTASEVSIDDTGAYFSSNNVEGALQELGLALLDVDEALSVQEVVVR
jgi:hypothetical protein